MEGSDGAGSEVGVEVNTEEEDKLWRVLTGSLQDLPPLSSKIVRIFTSSTFTGTTHLTTHFTTHLTTHLSHNSSLNLSHNSSHNSSYNRSLLYISVCLSVYLFFFFNTVHLSQLLCLLFYDWRCISHLVSLYLLFTCRTLLFYDIFSCICFTQIIDGFVYLPFNFSNMSYDFSDSCENFSCLPAFNVGKGGGTPVRLSSLTSLTLFITKSKPLRRVCSHNLEEFTRTTRGPVCFRPKYVCGR